MSKDKTKNLIKTARKTAKEEIKISLSTELKAIADKLVPGSKKIDKVIKKEAKFLAAKIAKKMVIRKAQFKKVEPVEEPPVTA